MAIVRSRSAFCGAVLGLIALLTAFGATTWHNSDMHDDASVHAVTSDHDHAPDPGEADSAIHLAAHIIGQGLDLPTASMSTPAMPVAGAVWSIALILPVSGVDPASLLRPPQA